MKEGDGERGLGGGGRERERVSWYFEPSQPLGAENKL